MSSARPHPHSYLNNLGTISPRDQIPIPPDENDKKSNKIKPPPAHRFRLRDSTRQMLFAKGNGLVFKGKKEESGEVSEATATTPPASSSKDAQPPQVGFGTSASSSSRKGLNSRGEHRGADKHPNPQSTRRKSNSVTRLLDESLQKKLLEGKGLTEHAVDADGGGEKSTAKTAATDAPEGSDRGGKVDAGESGDKPGNFKYDVL